jgi:glutathione synthase/RimK-type ligase-like ATP-grasp enzyme
MADGPRHRNAGVTARIALVSARAARGMDEDMPPLQAAFAQLGAHSEIADWDDPQVEWRSFDLALLRSAWDYTERLAQFLGWVERTAAVTRLLNPVAVVRWNSDKHYLLTLAGQGVPIVPSTFAEPGADVERVLQEFLAQSVHEDVVVKPAVGACSRDTRRHARDRHEEICTHVRRLLEAGRSALLQPYLAGVDRDGETALIFIDGQFSHAIRKGPLLPRDGQATAALFAPEDIIPRAPAADELALAERLLKQLPVGKLLYARVDLIRDADGKPRLLELELTEPSLFFAHAPDAAARFAVAALRRAGR